MKRFAMVITLSCVLSGSALAGEIPMVGPAPPPPSGATQTTIGETPNKPGEIPSDRIAGQISDAAVSVLLTVFGLLA